MNTSIWAGQINTLAAYQVLPIPVSSASAKFLKLELPPNRLLAA